ncbi:glutathionylspermidine synthase family protein [Paenibacillus sp. PAMC21692]|uniref:glutathionylspermidine synthase family protein n=1 Tax=Paenibacillus sp. PAMC21692 TaxID=2762320 RepID=UPI00164DB7EF|nr:glutathionylspermidine synthase family protein [Paenibacillus sp. PAMC21692]QNK59068.1 glutathionylspermidine synthase family protein [Paenibacillus sp. PAMC21692]
MTKPAFEILTEPHPDRAARVDALKELGFGWADIEDEQYWIDQIVALDRNVYEELRQASVMLWRVFDKAVRHIHGNHGIYELIGIPPILWEMVDGTPLPEPGFISRYARFDFAIDQDGTIKLLELNADTPTGYVEASIATPWLCGEAGVDTVNAGMKELVAAAWGEERPDTAACVAYGEHAEDSGTIEALVRHSGLEVACRDCLELYVDEGELKDAGGRVIERMFALYPKEWMAVDEGGDALAYSIETGKLKLFNLPPAILLQTKGLMAVVWGLYELGQLFDEEERNAIGRYFLPTYNKPVFDGSYVSKSMFGREGGSVRLFDESGGLELEDQDGYDTSVLFPTVYQKRAKLATVHTSRGELHLLIGMFVINGQPCGLLGRGGGPITGNTSHYIPIGVR